MGECTRAFIATRAAEHLLGQVNPRRQARELEVPDRVTAYLGRSHGRGRGRCLKRARCSSGGGCEDQACGGSLSRSAGQAASSARDGGRQVAAQEKVEAPSTSSSNSSGRGTAALGGGGSGGVAWWGAGMWSIVIPTYNRLPILQKCLMALEGMRDWQLDGIVTDFEVVVVDDGSTDGTVEFVEAAAGRMQLAHVRLLQQQHSGAAAARNCGVAAARGTVVVFIDSDLIVTPDFLRQHALRLRAAFTEFGDDRAFSYGRVVNTSNFEDPQSEPFKLTDRSAAFFATGNVAIARRRLLEAGQGLPGGGPFDAGFSEYGWEDLELGERLRKQGAKIVHCPQAIGYHWHPPFSCDQLPRLIEQEKERGRNGVRFLRKHPNLGVRLMVQLTPLHELLWFLLTLGGLWNERTARPLLDAAVHTGRPGVAAGLLSPILNWHTVQAAKDEAARMRGATQ